MRFALMTEPQQGLSYVEQLELARLAERLGFETFFRSDHYRSFPGPDDRPTTDAWTVLAGIARETTRIRLGTLVSPVTFRHPGSFAKVVTTVDEMSGGRIEVGVGAGWNEPEHRQLGLAFPEIVERADLMEDELAILHGLWEEPDGWSFEGEEGPHRSGFVQSQARPTPPSADHRRRRGEPPLAPLGGPLCRRVQHVQQRSRRLRQGLCPAGRRVPQDRPGSRRRDAVGHGGAADRAETRPNWPAGCRLSWP